MGSNVSYTSHVGLSMSLHLRIDKGSPGGALYIDTSIHNYDGCHMALDP